MTRLPLRRRALGTTLAALLLAACERGELTAPVDLPAGTVTLNSSTGWAYLSLASGAAVTPGDPLTSPGWDIAFNATSVMLNGGQAGPGGVSGYCVCQNAAANPTNDQILALTADGELADFAAVTAAAIPGASQFVTDTLTPVITGWYNGSGASATAAADRAWLVRLRDSTAYAKVRVASIQAPTAASAGRVTLEYAVQSGTTGALGPARTLAVDVPASGNARVDLLGGAVATAGGAWDLQLDGWRIRVNGGASGSGKAAATLATQPFAAVANAFAGAANAYRTDTYAGVFGQKPWYKYNLRGDNRISPTFDVYLVRRGSAVYKLQIINYYGPAGETRRITVRYAQLAS
jgi:hypothetical protein